MRQSPAQFIEEQCTILMQIHKDSMFTKALTNTTNRQTDPIVQYWQNFDPNNRCWPGGRPRSLGFEIESKTDGLKIEGADVPYISYQYDGGITNSAFSARCETARAIVYTLWYDDIHRADDLEQKFRDLLLKSGRIVGLGVSNSFRDSSTARPIAKVIGATPIQATLFGIQREVVIRS